VLLAESHSPAEARPLLSVQEGHFGCFTWLDLLLQAGHHSMGPSRLLDSLLCPYRQTNGQSPCICCCADGAAGIATGIVVWLPKRRVGQTRTNLVKWGGEYGGPKRDTQLRIWTAIGNQSVHSSEAMVSFRIAPRANQWSRVPGRNSLDGVRGCISNTSSIREGRALSQPPLFSIHTPFGVLWCPRWRQPFS
jgi:hypothetical protein